MRVKIAKGLIFHRVKMVEGKVSNFSAWAPWSTESKVIFMPCHVILRALPKYYSHVILLHMKL